MSLIIPEHYSSLLSLRDTQVAIKQVKDFFQCELAKSLNLTRVSAPLFVPKSSGLNDNLTASNFGNLGDLASRSDIALGIVNMVSETVAMMAIFAARNFGLKNIVLTGNLTTMNPVRRTFEGLQKPFGVNFIIPELSQYGTVIGAALQ